MGLNLPVVAYLCTMKDDFDFSGDGFDSFELNWGVSPPAVLFSDEADPDYLRTHEQIKLFKEVWCLDDGGDGIDPSRITGYDRRFDDMSSIYVFKSRAAALAALARCDEAVGLLWKLWKSGPTQARPLARSVLEGDEQGLPVLADLLDERGHPLAEKVRAIGAAE
jgi:hypothetical protein